MELSEQNTSGQGINSVVPQEVKKHFNWGAFLFTCIWGIGNNTFLTLIIFLCLLLKDNQVLCFIVGLALEIWFGIKGNEWAWRNKRFASIEHFHNYQKKWVKAFFIIFVGIPLVCAALGMIVTLIIPPLIHSAHP